MRFLQERKRGKRKKEGGKKRMGEKKKEKKREEKKREEEEREKKKGVREACAVCTALCPMRSLTRQMGCGSCIT